jgi:chloramphenicol O-acetyltransferase
MKKALITGIDGVKDAKIIIFLDEKSTSNYYGAKIKKFEVFVQLTSEKIEKIKIGNQSINNDNKKISQVPNKIIKTLCEFYQLKNEQVTVNLYVQ